MCPVYHHLYIQVAQTEQEALRQSFAIEDWYVNGIALIDFEEYQLLSEKQKEEKVFNIIVSGLKDIATIDHLDFSIIDNIVKKIQENGLDTELTFRTIENNSHKLQITYLSRNAEEECPIFLNLTDKTKNVTKCKKIGTADKYQIYLWLQKITLTKKQIKVKSSSTSHAKVWLQNKPDNMIFDIEELMK